MLDDLMLEFRRVSRKDGEKKIELITDIRIETGTRALVDIKLVDRIIRSLFLNSLKNTSSGYIKIGLSCSEDKLTFSVIDTGRGYVKYRDFLSASDINEALSRHDDLAGAININLIKKIVQILGGTIWIEHNDIEGAGIYFSIPAKIFTGHNNGLNDAVFTKAVTCHY